MRRRDPPDRLSLRRRRRRCSPAAGARSRSRTTRRPRTRARSSSTSAAPAATRSTPPTPTARSRRAPLQGGERTNGPNFNVRKVSRDDVLFAIRNGGFSGAIMPANIVVGEEAEAVADFLSKYSGKESGTNDPTASGQGRTRPAGVRCSTSGRSARTRRRRAPRSPAAASTSPCSTRRSSSTSAGARSCPSWRSCAARRTRPPSGSASCSAIGEDASAAIAEVKRRLGAREGARRGAALGGGAPPAAVAALPNLPDATAPARDEVLREEGEAGATGRSHVELLGEHLDLEAGARVAGARFAYLKGPLVRLELALVQWVLTLLEEKGFVAGGAAGARARAGAVRHRLPARHRAADLSRARRRPVSSGHERGAARIPARGEILGPDTLPLRYAGFSTCFRREAGAAGKDTQGIFRVHQFDKVEMFTFVEPEESQDEHERLLAIEEEILQALGIPYRVVNIAVDDLGNSASKKYDLEAWLPGQGRYRELTSCSNTTDLPGAPTRRAPASTRGCRPAPRAHAERHRRGRRADDHRDRGEPPARRWQRGDSGGAARVRRAGDDLMRPVEVIAAKRDGRELAAESCGSSYSPTRARRSPTTKWPPC